MIVCQVQNLISAKAQTKFWLCFSFVMKIDFIVEGAILMLAMTAVFENHDAVFSYLVFQCNALGFFFL